MALQINLHIFNGCLHEIYLLWCTIMNFDSLWFFCCSYSNISDLIILYLFYRVATIFPRLLFLWIMWKSHHLSSKVNSKWKLNSLLVERRLLVWMWSSSWASWLNLELLNNGSCKDGNLSGQLAQQVLTCNLYLSITCPQLITCMPIKDIF